ncbi:hypothetical protein SAMN05421823_102552 [Catalinimonas alkaloidigena]|uniref:HTH cro/C1-type domain-containing protein n=2 Tax=Catalinimonas alkaloidigena TaxID=1075417 RepID=A0A1G9B949_9BACT|nr:hypothetical protein SAMN05421823_102552 [Catalinimonas alkaloidigena]
MKQRRVSEGKLASDAGMTSVGFKKMLKNGTVRVSTLFKISDSLNVPIETLLGNQSGYYQHADRGGVNLANSTSRDVTTISGEEAIRNANELDVCRERVKGLEREVALLKELNEVLKKR